MKIGIISLVYNNWNLGGMLQGYALYKYLNSKGYCAAHLMFPFWKTKEKGLRSFFEDLISRFYIANELYESIMLRKRSDKRELTNFRTFQKTFVDKSNYYNWDSIRKANKKFDCFITGSDQVWNYDYFSEKVLNAFGLFFVDDEKRKIAYAASVGSGKSFVTGNIFFQNLLNRLDYISVREQSIKDDLMKLSHKGIQVTVDPTFLLDREQWENEITNPAKGKSYVFSYFLNEKDNRHCDECKHIADLIGKPMICITDEVGLYTRENDEQVLDAGPREFLGYIRNAECVITNSFHGVVFSLIFRKKFLVFGRYGSGDSSAANDRIWNLLQMTGLQDRYVETGEFIGDDQLNMPIDYDKVWEILDISIARSKEWICKALQ